MVAVSLLFVAICFVGDLSRLAGVVLLAALAIVLGVTARETARKREADRGTPLEWVLGLPRKTAMIVLFIIAGAVGLPLGATMLVESAVKIAEHLQISDAVVGLTIVALGTSLPELSTSVVAALRRHASVALGTAIGSNVFNILAIMGIAAAASPAPIAVPPGFSSLDLPVMLGASLLLALLIWRGRPIGRLTGVVLVLAYVVYLGGVFSLV
jgi:cation:H+ antiporter